MSTGSELSFSGFKKLETKFLTPVTNLGASVGKKFLNVNGEYVEVWRVPSATLYHRPMYITVRINKLEKVFYLIF